MNARITDKGRIITTPTFRFSLEEVNLGVGGCGGTFSIHGALKKPRKENCWDGDIIWVWVGACCSHYLIQMMEKNGERRINRIQPLPSTVLVMPVENGYGSFVTFSEIRFGGKPPARIGFLDPHQGVFAAKDLSDYATKVATAFTPHLMRQQDAIAKLQVDKLGEALVGVIKGSEQMVSMDLTQSNVATVDYDPVKLLHAIKCEMTDINWAELSKCKTATPTLDYVSEYYSGYSELYSTQGTDCEVPNRIKR